ncbi:hypothetical protein [Sphingosinicella sp. BN140058]|uniref:hypothetical protein n=1 Tax=Sphingosinicella sp. BN140058 TaxID=1892855 RepID=UPI0010125E70|nr:hypothetical protein [Sphingosinicella sp. BN140058]QAY75935.1 hypothetical protein ETR14_04885 [Sphingosinicella sp. BN140058]
MLTPGLVLLIAQALPSGGSNAPSKPPEAPPMACETGRVQRRFGGTDWIVLSCADKLSMVVVSAPGNPASPFYFFLKPGRDGGYTIVGEGNGDRQASDAAGDALSKMTVAEMQALLAETRSAAR